ncbi:BnaCnng77800D, partial [Brassica napus]
MTPKGRICFSATLLCSAEFCDIIHFSFLARRINSRLAPKEREELYMKRDVPLEGKQRKLQFVNKIWTDPYDSRHMQESTEIVAKLVGFCESGNISKEMFELNFAMPSDKRWNI